MIFGYQDFIQCIFFTVFSLSSTSFYLQKNIKALPAPPAKIALGRRQDDSLDLA